MYNVNIIVGIWKATVWIYIQLSLIMTCSEIYLRSIDFEVLGKSSYFREEIIVFLNKSNIFILIYTCN